MTARPSPSTAPLSSEFLAALVEAWNSHDLERVAAFYAENYYGEDVAFAAPARGRDTVRNYFARYLQAFPDLRFTVEDTVVEGDRATLVWRGQGTHRGALMNIPASGRAVAVRGVSVLTVCNGQITHAKLVWDVAGLLRAIGLLPEL